MQSISVHPNPGADSRSCRLADRANRPIAHSHVNVIGGCDPLVLFNSIAKKAATYRADNSAKRTIVVTCNAISDEGAAEAAGYGTDTVRLALYLHGVEGFDHTAILASCQRHLVIAARRLPVFVAIVCIPIGPRGKLLSCSLFMLPTFLDAVSVLALLVAPSLLVAGGVGYRRYWCDLNRS